MPAGKELSILGVRGRERKVMEAWNSVNEVSEDFSMEDMASVGLEQC